MLYVFKNVICFYLLFISVIKITLSFPKQISFYVQIEAYISLLNNLWMLNIYINIDINWPNFRLKKWKPLWILKYKFII